MASEVRIVHVNAYGSCHQFRFTTFSSKISKFREL
ncbi:hypothetical protein T10_3226 [Trichinella papuae]|uniref:Uncharacterized protein n=1 Tax=Trichinella papuae TaxID=268474 RepID=A0A0V1LYR0_9BILA|nr:hypothetical protein T10_3226 [Trichinella papuae]